MRVVKLGAISPDRACRRRRGRRDHCAVSHGDESFEGYWRRPDADAKALREGWYFTGDTGYFDADGDLFVTGRVDDMIITGGENVSPVEIESCLSLHPAVSEVAVVGLADERWGKVVAAFVKRRDPVADAELDQFCRASGLANFKRPRRYVFVDEIPKSPVGKLLRRKLVAGEYDAEQTRQPAVRMELQHDDNDFRRSPPRHARRLPRRDRRRRASAPTSSSTGRRSTSSRCRNATSCGWCSRRSTRTRACASIVLRAVGEHFSSGGNIKGFMEASPEHVSKLAWNIAAPARCSKPVIAANRGYCFGVGFEISLACDFRIASETCFYALPEQKLGQIPGSGGSARLAENRRHHPHQGHRDALASAFRRKQAYEWGIATECVPDGKLEAATDALVNELRTFSPIAQRTAKKLLNDTEDATLSTAIELEGHCYSRLRQSDDFREGVEAFHAKRTPKFKGT